MCVWGGGGGGGLHLISENEGRWALKGVLLYRHRVVTDFYSENSTA